MNFCRIFTFFMPLKGGIIYLTVIKEVKNNGKRKIIASFKNIHAF